jgi:hypothetical protein
MTEHWSLSRIIRILSMLFCLMNKLPKFISLIINFYNASEEFLVIPKLATFHCFYSNSR